MHQIRPAHSRTQFFFKSILTHSKGSQGSQKILQNMLRINVLSSWPFGSQNIKNRVFRFELFSVHHPLCRSAETSCWDGPLAGLLGITWYSRQDPEMAWRSFFAVQQQLFFWAINKTEVQKIDIKIKVEVSSWLRLDKSPYFCPNQDPEAIFLDFDLSKYQFVCFFVLGYFSAQQTAFVCRKFQK